MGRRILVVFLVACAGCTAAALPTTTTTMGAPPATAPTATGPMIGAATPTASTVDRYGLYELVVDLTADYDNPYDQRQVALDAEFVAPSGARHRVPGFWDGREAWRLRFTPDEAGQWSYTMTVADHAGSAESGPFPFTVAASDHPGFLRVGSQVDPSYSDRYFAYEDGSSWYGRGHADLDMSLGGAAADGSGLRKFTEMADSGENLEMWWPTWGNNFIQVAHDDYTSAQLQVIDYVLADAVAKGVAVVFTVWIHQYLRTGAHDWPDDRWRFNGFSELTDIDGFFTDDEAWAWQENYYRYIIARWSHSPAIVMWQTITEINGTESYEHTDDWHRRVDRYFRDNDPFRHPTTATGSGSWDWPTGHAVMDVPQMHLYEDFVQDPIDAAAQVAHWTRLMWEREEKPNWIGEYGERGQQYYPEMLHAANWAALGAGAAITPIEWNDQSGYGAFDAAMVADMRRFADFVEEVPLVTYDPESLAIVLSADELRGWGVAGDSGGVVWVQDAALEGAGMEAIRSDRTVRPGVVLTADLAPGPWRIRPYDTWRGEWLAPVDVDCPGGPCAVPLPDFSRDLALALAR